MLILSVKYSLKKGFNGTSLDDIVKGTGVLRGSLYSAFGSKLGMFTAALTASLSNYSKQKNLELVLIAMLEVAPNNKEVRSILNKWYEANNQTDIAEKNRFSTTQAEWYRRINYAK